LPDVGSEDRAVFAGIGAALTALGSTALALSMMGVYALLSFSITARTRELAVRSALGASRIQLLRTVLTRAVVPLVIGAATGPVVSAALIAARGIFVFRLPSEAGAFPLAGLCAVLAVSALAAAWVPSRRALRISIADALKADS
jgi:ABC-type antimicrobial peptide transport system permease subunit